MHTMKVNHIYTLEIIQCCVIQLLAPVVEQDMCEVVAYGRLKAV